MAGNLLILKLRALTCSEIVDFAIIQFKKCTEPLHEVESVIGCVCVRWGIFDKLDPALDARAGSKNAELHKVGEWFGCSCLTLSRNQ